MNKHYNEVEIARISRPLKDTDKFQFSQQQSDITNQLGLSSVQRRFNVVYNRAARMIEDIEAASVVNAQEGNGSREVLAPPPPKD